LNCPSKKPSRGIVTSRTRYRRGGSPPPLPQARPRARVETRPCATGRRATGRSRGESTSRGDSARADVEAIVDVPGADWPRRAGRVRFSISIGSPTRADDLNEPRAPRAPDQGVAPSARGPTARRERRRWPPPRCVA
jgi:hypothetical protein